eukprot:CAMPEP_0202072440 /NCGR_PEP_ID=MMETSP0964-20121228/2422_1 /ASSEMBLY_ACC=CAM_ASM_000500 /TAXON_ID=4773 /ORGANISM="Schizochytrium aggregatum, Strain ATCC28209" /LENGTH=41 /DNA_ID= /DNA_START= /DNA_END= /DNA_ORIENTATION=
MNFVAFVRVSDVTAPIAAVLSRRRRVGSSCSAPISSSKARM